MRCPKCQYLGFEPSPRCKNCGYDFSFESGDLLSISSPSEPEALADFDLQVLDSSRRQASAASPVGGFDLDDLLARGRSGADPADSGTRAAAAPAVAVAIPAHPAATRTAVEEPPASAVAPSPSPSPSPAPAPKPMPAAVVPPPRVRISASAPSAAPAQTPVTTELPLFMQVMSDQVVAEASAGTPVAALRPGMPLTIEAATEAEHAASHSSDEADDRPLVRVPAVLRPPLAVRRTTPDPAKLRAKYARATPKAAAPADNDLLKGIDDVKSNLNVSPDLPSARLSAEPTPESLPAGWLQGVSAGKRIFAAAIDGLILAGINAAIVWFTLKLVGLGPAQANLLPLIPLGLFFLLVDGGYLVMFTAACGQTIGKMAAGIRVVGTNTGAVINDRITIGQAIARSLGAIASCVPLGAGFWMSLVGDGRAMHDRIAHTRVVRA